ncbi:E3 ubiquitin protein ligase drip2 [Thalictrum thalictroides]|uniref:E3 ubiquitin protein ligase drip2 n=1 Tax=Thalictrum thalictroides TaxID=46969 RepID=A0A7J6VQU3_THATH|nr:E3 ubiquitin protein ligase drip2 [Thalictrum thalictroides]
MMANQVVKLRKEAIVARITCSICNKLFRDATTISECLHTFCRKCIYKKLTHEELDRCPKCSINLGCAPLEKLRPDHNLQDVRAKIFPFKRRKVSAPENMASISLPVRRKERSLSSLVVSTPRVSPQTSMTGRRTKSIARKAVALRGSGFSIDQSVKREEVPMEGCPESSSSRETLNKLSHHKRQTSGNLYNNLNSCKNEENNSENPTGKADLWKPLNTLVEAANRTKSIKFHSQGSDAKPETPQTANNGTRGSKGKVKKNSHKKRNDDDNDSTSVGLAKSKKLSRAKRKRKSATEELGASAQAILSSSVIKRDRSGPIWFQLVASEDREGNRSLPQISSSYVRLRDGDIPVLVIQKYVMQKLDLANEDEVEITCRGQPVDPTLQLPTVVDAWLQTASRSERIQASVGASGKDFVMVLAYRRKIQPKEVL